MRTFTFHSSVSSGEIFVIPIEAEDLAQACVKFDQLHPEHDIGIILFHPEPGDHRPVVNWGEWVKVTKA